MNDTYYVVAYANESTDWDWEMICLCDDLCTAKRDAERRLPNMPKSTLGIFVRSCDGKYWKDRRPLALYQKWNLDKALNPDGLISSALGGIINQRESDWF